MAGLPKSIVTHSQRVCRLYKKAIRNVENYSCGDRITFRYEAVMMRKRFDDTRSETDMKKLAAMLDEAEAEINRLQHPDPFVFKNDPGGIVFDRPHLVPDTVLDYWHPWEKAQYMDYFETREKRKEEYSKYYENSILAKGQKENVDDDYLKSKFSGSVK